MYYWIFRHISLTTALILAILFMFFHLWLRCCFTAMQVYYILVVAEKMSHLILLIDFHLLIYWIETLQKVGGARRKYHVCWSRLLSQNKGQTDAWYLVSLSNHHDHRSSSVDLTSQLIQFYSPTSIRQLTYLWITEYNMIIHWL